MLTSIHIKVVALLLLALLWLMPQPASAQSKNCTDETSECSLAEAKAQCEAYQPTPAPPVTVVTRKECGREGNNQSGYIYMFYWGLVPGNDSEQGRFNAGRYWYWRNKCGTEPRYTGTGPWSSERAARSGSIGCRNSCDGIWFGNADGTKTWIGSGDTCPDDERERCKQFPDHFWNSILNVCEPPEGNCPGGVKPNSLGQCAPEPCPAGMVMQADGTCKNKENECPAGMVKSPSGQCLPGDGQCAQGEVRGKDGTCKKDADGDGEPDEEQGGDDPDDPDGKKKEEFSGGDDCKTPPSCSGSPILCGTARIQWRIDCNTRKNRNIAGGTCGTMPICTGDKCDALEYSSLLMNWRTACAVEKLSQGGGGTGESGIKDHLTAMKQAEVNALRALGQDDGHGGVDASDIWADADSRNQVNPGLFGSGGGTCDLSFTIGGNVVSPPSQFWQIVSMIHWLLIASTYVWVAYQLTR